MTTLALYGGPLKRDLIQLAFEECGQAGYEFELTPEEYDSALRRMDAFMADLLDQYGVDLGYNFPVNGTNGNPEDESGIPRGAVNAVSLLLSESIAPSIGKTLTPETRARLAPALTSLKTKYMTVPMMEMGRQTPRGAGNRYWSGPRPYFFVPISEDEIVQ